MMGCSYVAFPCLTVLQIQLTLSQLGISSKLTATLTDFAWTCVFSEVSTERDWLPHCSVSTHDAIMYSNAVFAGVTEYASRFQGAMWAWIAFRAVVFHTSVRAWVTPCAKTRSTDPSKTLLRTVQQKVIKSSWYWQERCRHNFHAFLYIGKHFF